MVPSLGAKIIQPHLASTLSLMGNEGFYRGSLAKRKGQTLSPLTETESFELIRHFISHENAVGFQIPVGLNPDEQPGMAHWPIVELDVRSASCFLGRKRPRVACGVGEVDTAVDYNVKLSQPFSFWSRLNSFSLSVLMPPYCLRQR